MPSDFHTNTVNLRPICRSTQHAARGAFFLRIADYAECNLQNVQKHAPFSRPFTRNEHNLTKKLSSYPSAVTMNYTLQLLRLYTCFVLSRHFTRKMWFHFYFSVSHCHVCTVRHDNKGQYRTCYTLFTAIYFLAFPFGYCMNAEKQRRDLENFHSLPLHPLVRSRFAGFFTCVLFRCKKRGCKQPKENNM